MIPLHTVFSALQDRPADILLLPGCWSNQMGRNFSSKSLPPIRKFVGQVLCDTIIDPYERPWLTFIGKGTLFPESNPVITRYSSRLILSRSMPFESVIRVYSKACKHGSITHGMTRTDNPDFSTYPGFTHRTTANTSYTWTR